MSAAPEQVAQRLYDAINGQDLQALMAALAPGFLGIVSDGMPLGVGGRHEGAKAMVRDCWGPVFMAFEMVLEVEERLVVGADRVVVRGRYVGTARESDRRVDAAFAHFLRIDGNRIAELRQVTDTVRWG